MSPRVLEFLMQFVAPLIVGLVTPLLMDAIKRHVPTLDATAPDAQRVLVAGVAAIGNALATMFGVTIGADPSAWSEVEVRSVLSAGIAFAVHAGNRAKAAKAIAAETARVRETARDAATGALAREFEARGEHPMTLPSAEDPR